MGFINAVNFHLCLVTLISLLYFVPLVSNVVLMLSALTCLVKFSGWLTFYARKYLFNSKVSAKNKAVLITGCDSGFGHALAKRLDEEGLVVFAGCLDKCGDGSKSLLSHCSSRLKAFQLDVTDDTSIHQAVEFVHKNLEQNVLWAVVNNAGISQAGEIDWTPMSEFDKVYDVNARGTVKVTKAFLPLLRQSKGRVINNTSLCAHLTCPGYVGYCMSKCAAESFTTGLRVELAKWGMRAISIEPFFYNTPITSKEASHRLIQQTWDKASDETRAVYGDAYLDSFKNCCTRVLGMSSDRVQDVIDCFEDAVMSSDPLDRYSPCHFLYELAMTAMHMFLPKVMESYQRLQLPYLVRPAALLKKGSNIIKNGSNQIEENGNHHTTASNGHAHHD